jgi:NAD(P)-dependent dehydrogenase (short-subunit alcohol dehydrogenase family)
MSDDQLPLQGQAALVTGGATGIGLSSARLLVADGASVTICARREDRLRESAAQLEKEARGGATVRWITCDVTDETQVEAAVAAAREALGGLHIAVASAGSGWPGPIITTPVEAFHHVIDTNLTGTFLTFKHAGAAIVQTGAGGAMCAISSLAGVRTHRGLGIYGVSKAAIDALVQNLADEVGRAGIRVNSVRPGLVETELVEGTMQVPGLVDDYIGNMPMGRVGQVDDVGQIVRFLVGPESSWITGESISVDGGHHLRSGPDYEPVTRAFMGDAAIDDAYKPA